MSNRIPAYRLMIIDKLKMTRKPFANRIAEIMEINGISDLQIESTMTDCIIELEKLLEKKDKMLKKLQRTMFVSLLEKN